MSKILYKTISLILKPFNLFLSCPCFCSPSVMEKMRCEYCGRLKNIYKSISDKKMQELINKDE